MWVCTYVCVHSPVCVRVHVWVWWVCTCACVFACQHSLAVEPWSRPAQQTPVLRLTSSGPGWVAPPAEPQGLLCIGLSGGLNEAAHVRCSVLRSLLLMAITVCFYPPSVGEKAGSSPT